MTHEHASSPKPAPAPHIGVLERPLIRVIERGAAEHILEKLAQRRRPLHPDAAGAHTTVAREAAERLAIERFPIVSLDHLVHIVDLAFATSTEMDEGRAQTFTLSLVPREQIGERQHWSLLLRDPITLDADTLRKLAPAADIWTTCLLVDEGLRGQPEVWGIWSIPSELDPHDWPVPTELVVRATGPASIHVAVSGERVWGLERGAPVEARATDRSVHALFRALDAGHHDARPSALWAIVREIERRGNGGTLALCGEGEGDWVSGHRVTSEGPTIELLARLARTQTSAKGPASPASCPKVPFAPGCPNVDVLVQHARFRNTARAIAGLANVDGAVILRMADLRVEAFAARLASTTWCDEVTVAGSVGGGAHSIPVARLGGMRHQSAAQWVAGRTGRIAIVVSTNGVVSLFSGGKGGGGVAAFRPLTQGIDRDLA